MIEACQVYVGLLRKHRMARIVTTMTLNIVSGIWLVMLGNLAVAGFIFGIASVFITALIASALPNHSCQGATGVPCLCNCGCEAGCPCVVDRPSQ